MAVNKILLLYLVFLLWIYILYVLRKEKLTAFRFMIGSSGFFCFLFIIFKNVIATACAYVLESILLFLSKFFSFYTVYMNYNMIFINNKEAAISLVIDYECCGVIEILVSTSIIMFFPLFKLKKKIICSAIGIAYITLANTIRLLCVSYVIYIKGNNYYYLAHSIVGRIVFYILTVVFYFYMLSWQQIKNQRVGKFDYN